MVATAEKCGSDAAGGVKNFATGAVRSADAEDTRYDLISPIGLEAVARACAEGAAKYGDFNWEKGMPVHDLLNHVLRHVYKFLSGDRSEEHLGHAAWGVLAAIHSEAAWPELNAGHLRGEGCMLPGKGYDDRRALADEIICWMARQPATRANTVFLAECLGRSSQEIKDAIRGDARFVPMPPPPREGVIVELAQ